MLNVLILFIIYLSFILYHCFLLLLFFLQYKQHFIRNFVFCLIRGYHFWLRWDWVIWLNIKHGYTHKTQTHTRTKKPTQNYWTSCGKMDDDMENVDINISETKHVQSNFLKKTLDTWRSFNSSSLRYLMLLGGTTRAQWEDVTGSTPLTFVNDCVSFTTTVSARFWLMDCRNIGDATKMATELYKYVELY